MKLGKRSISISLVAMLLIGMAAIFPVQAQAPTVFVDPAATVLYTDTSGIGSTFSIYVDVVDVTALFAYEFKIKWNNDSLKMLSAVRPAGQFLQPVDPTKEYVAFWDMAYAGTPTTQTGYFSYTMLSPEVGRTGGGHLVQFTFQIMMTPPFGETITNLFDLFEVILVNDSAQEIPGVITTDGTYELIYVLPLPNHYLSVNPVNTVIPPGAPVVGTPASFFDVYVDVNSLLADWWIVGIEFKLAYNGSLIEFVSAQNDTYLDGFGDIYFVPPVLGMVGDLNYVNTAVLLLPHSSPPPVWNNPISGTGHLVKLTFKVIHQEAFPWIATSPLDLYDTIFADRNGAEVPGVEPHDGQVTINGFIIGRMIDLYDQYPAPYGGQGPFMPSDMFWPQKEVELYTNVTYNLWPVQQKLVGFEVRDPAGNVVAILTATTDEFGVAHTSYRIPWPCDNPEALFGVWTITATVDIACVVVNDTMSFHFDYLVHWYGGDYKVTTDKTEYAHGETIDVTIEFGSHAQQPHQVLITADLVDELGYSIGVAYTIVEVSGATYCQLKNYTVTLPIPINKWVAAGIAKLHVSAFSTWPTLGGSPWAPEYVPLPEVTILPA